MDIFKFENPNAPTKMESGKIVTGLTSKLWIERFDIAGDFQLKAPVSTGLKDILPAGTFISHINTDEIMRVENHEISEEKGKEAELIVTGRSFESFLENRVVGSNKTFPTNSGVTDYSLDQGKSYDQAVSLISDHILASELIDDDNAIPYVEVMHDVTGGVDEARTLRKGDLHARLIELLSIDKLGVKTIRPGLWSPAVNSQNVVILIHAGVDRSNEVVFSYATGEIETADYLWSEKKLKNCAMVEGRWVSILVDSADVGIERRMMYVDASDIDQSQTEAPIGSAYALIQEAMRQRGLLALASQNAIAITKADASREGVKAVYRSDFNVGDIIMVNGNYDETAPKRISEYVEIEDETGNVGYPTFINV